MPLLEQQAEAQPAAAQPPMQEEPPMQEGEEGSETLTVTAEAVAAEIIKKADPNTAKRIELFVDAGMKVLFKDDDSHHAIFDGIDTNDEVPIANEIGSGAVNLATQLLSEAAGGGEVRQDMLDAIGPAGYILIAKVLEFVNETGIDVVTDQDYYDAVEIFVVALDRELKGKKQEEAMPEEGMPPEQQQQAPIMPQQQMQMPQQGGLLQQGGMA